MGVRLILVSVVAGLGLTLPNAKQATSWRDSAQTWVSARLAEYDARMPADEKAFIYVADALPIPADDTDFDSDAIATTTTTSKATPATAPADTPTFTPARALTEMAAPATITAATAEVLAVGIETPTEPMNFDEIETIAPAPVVENLTTTTITDLELNAAFGVAQLETLANFAADLSRTAEHGKSQASDEPPVNLAVNDRQAELTAEASDLGEADDLQEGLTYLYQEQPTTVCEVVASEAGEKGGLILDDDLYPGTAFALNREADGLNSSLNQELVQDRGVVTRAETPGTISPLSQAMKLTREAVYAWANLVHAPAVVTINR